jgi:TRAP-type mannitol/chloroaromatic compound transport system permease small subunit
VVRGVGVAACCVLLPVQIVLGVFYVVARPFFSFQLTPLQELEWHLFFALVFLCLGMTHLADRHVRIDILRGRFSERTRAIIEIVGFLVALLPFALAMIYYGTDNVIVAFVTGERSRAPLGLPYRWIVKCFIPIGGVLLLAAGSLITIRNLQRLAGGAIGADRGAASRKA